MSALEIASGEMAPEALSIVEALSVPEGTIVADMTAGAQRVIDEIRREYELAQSAKQSAIEHAVRCGNLLLAVKARLPHGEFGSWIEARCGIAYSTAARYMTAARRISTGIEISSLSGIFPSGRKTERPRKALPAPQSSPAAPSDSAATASTPTASGSDMTAEQAITVIRGQNNFARKYSRLLKSESDALKEIEKLRKALARAELIHRNAVTSIIGVAKKINTEKREAIE